MSRRASALLAAALIVTAGLAAYWNSFDGAFVFDDDVQGKRLCSLRLWPISGALAGPRPVIDFSFALNNAFTPSGLRGYHVFNLAVHIFAALTLYGIMRRTLPIAAFDFAQAQDCSLRLRSGQGLQPSTSLRPRIADCRTDGPQSRGTSNLQSSIPACRPAGRRNLHSAIALAIALIWLVHPLQTESVTYVIQRAESLMGLFYLLTLYCAMRSFSASRPWPWRAAAIAACAIGMGCKPVMVTAPLMVLIYDLIFVKPSIQDPRLPAGGPAESKIQSRWLFYAGLAATWSILGALLWRHPAGPTAGFAIQKATPWQYASAQPGVIVHYLRLSFDPTSLCLDYDWPVARTAADILPSAIGVGILLAATVWALWRAPAFGFLGVWFFLILAPTSSIMPIADLCVEHRMYLPLAAVVALVVTVGCAVGGKILRAVPAESRKRLGWMLGVSSCLIVAAAFGYRTVLRNEQYASELSMWLDVVRERRDNPRAHYNLGAALLKRQRNEEAIPFFARATALLPTFTKAHHNLGVAYYRLGMYEQALAEFARASALDPTYLEAHQGLAATLSKLGRAEEAASRYREVERLKAKAK